MPILHVGSWLCRTLSFCSGKKKNIVVFLDFVCKYLIFCSRRSWFNLLTVFPLPRHLSMIAGLLHGRIHLNMQEFRQQNHMTFFSNVLAILELLQPLVFHSGHQGALQDCLLSFMKVLQVGSAHIVKSLSNTGFRIGIRRNNFI